MAADLPIGRNALVAQEFNDTVQVVCCSNGNTSEVLWTHDG